MSETITTPFEERKEHFANEKQFLAQKFGKFLIERIRRKCQGLNQVILFIDAGTTLFPFFEVLNSLDKKQNQGWLRELVVVTNNVAGVYWLSKQVANKSSELAFNCILLPGKLLPEYNAITGFEGSLEANLAGVLQNLKTHNQIEGIKALRDRKEEISSPSSVKVTIMALVTGNWVRVRNEKPTLPVPLARGRGHLQVKKSMMSAADEVYVISPLGKVFSGFEKDYFESLLSQTQNHSKNYSEAYEELNTADADLHVNNSRTKIKLITTFRPGENFILSKSSEKIYNLLYDSAVKKVTQKTFEDDERKFVSASNYRDIPHYMFEFRDVSADLIKQFETEIPHKYCHFTKFLYAFHIPKNVIEEIRIHKNFSIMYDS